MCSQADKSKYCAKGRAELGLTTKSKVIAKPLSCFLLQLFPSYGELFVPSLYKPANEFLQVVGQREGISCFGIKLRQNPDVGDTDPGECRIQIIYDILSGSQGCLGFAGSGGRGRSGGLRFGRERRCFLLISYRLPSGGL